jgi:hypothetical protein
MDTSLFLPLLLQTNIFLSDTMRLDSDTTKHTGNEFSIENTPIFSDTPDCPARKLEAWRDSYFIQLKLTSPTILVILCITPVLFQLEQLQCFFHGDF